MRAHRCLPHFYADEHAGDDVCHEERNDVEEDTRFGGAVNIEGLDRVVGDDEIGDAAG